MSFDPLGSWKAHKASVARNLEELNRLLEAVRLAQERIDSGTNRLALFVAAYLISWGAFNLVAAYTQLFPQGTRAFDIFVLLNSLVSLPILAVSSWKRWGVIRREQTIRDATAAILWQLYRSRIDEIKRLHPLDGAFLYIQMAQYDFGDLRTNPLAIEAFSGLREQESDSATEAPPAPLTPSTR